MFKLTSLLAWRKSAARAADDSLDSFAPESAPRSDTGHRPARWRYAGALALAGLVGAAAAGAYVLNQTELLSASVPSASLTIESDPVGAVVTANGVRKGATPLTLAVPPGEYAFEILHGERRKQVRVLARAQTAVVHHVQFDLPAPEETKVADVPAPPRPERTKPAAVAAVPRGPAAGWLAITSHIPLHVLEQSQVIGSTAAPKIMLPAGKRELHLVNENLGFSVRRIVQIDAGRTTALAVAVPRAPVSINAVPWAEVWIDGARVGETPIGNHMVGLGSREIVFRHPSLGVRRQTVVVSLKAPARVSVDMRKAQ